MGLCPKDGKPCLDDLCHGGSCLKMPGGGPGAVSRCNLCGEYHMPPDTVCPERQPEPRRGPHGREDVRNLSDRNDE